MESDILAIEKDTIVKGVRHGAFEEVTIPEGITHIEKNAFYDCRNLKSITLPSTLEFIGEGAFINCRNLKSIYIPNKVKVIEKDAFKYCSDLEIYCEGEVKEGWIDTIGIILVEDSYTTDEDYAFDFHRGGVTRHTYYRKEKGEICWNPSKRPVHTNITRGEYESLTKE